MASDPTSLHMESNMKCLESMLGSVIYDIPPIQRNYSWEKKHAEQLISNIESFMSSDKPWLFMGPIVELEDPDGSSARLIVDGQQRFSTLTIMFCALRDYLWWRYEVRNRIYSDIINASNEDTAAEGEGNIENEEERVEEEYPTILNGSVYELFESPEINHENINFKFYPGQDTYPTICALAEWINRTIIVNTEEPENPILRLTLKNDDKKRLQFLQNPVWGTKYTQNLNNDRKMPPGRLDPDDYETVEVGRSKMYTNYDYFLGYFKEKFESHGTEVIFCNLNDGVYEPIMVNQGGQQIQKKGLIHTEEQLKNAFNWFLRFAKQTCFSNMAFTQIIVRDWPTAYDIFVSTNATGKPLSLADLIRAMIISELYGEDQDLIERAEENLNKVAEDEDLLHEQEKAFMRAHWISRNAQKQSASSIAKLYGDEIKKADATRLLEITAEIAEDVAHYNSARSPETATQNGRIMDYFIRAGCRQHIPLMMAAHRAGYSEEELMSIHELAECLYTIHYKTGGNPSKYEALFAEASGEINAGHPVDDVVSNLSARAKAEIFPVHSFEDFKKNFAAMNDDKEAWWHYVFRRIEIHLQQAEHQGGDEIHAQYLVGENKEINLEHILPQSIKNQDDHGEYWRSRFGEHGGQKHKNNLWKVGNLTLLDQYGNQAIAGNKKFPWKKNNAYRKVKLDDAGVQVEPEGEQGSNKTWSYLKHTNQLEKYAHWTEKNIDARSDWLADKACKIWNAIDLDA